VARLGDIFLLDDGYLPIKKTTPTLASTKSIRWLTVLNTRNSALGIE